MTDRDAIIAAYIRHENAVGGIARADPNECVRLAAEECGVAYGVAREVLMTSPLFSGSFGSG